MSDIHGNPGGQDARRISLEQDYEVRYWSSKFGVSHEQLKQAVHQVGPMAENVEQYFRNQQANGATGAGSTSNTSGLNTSGRSATGSSSTSGNAARQAGDSSTSDQHRRS